MASPPIMSGNAYDKETAISADANGTSNHAQVLKPISTDTEKDEGSSTAIASRPPSPDAVQPVADEKQHHGTLSEQEKGGAGIEKVGQDVGTGEVNQGLAEKKAAREEDEDEIFYPGGLQLSILTLGLCLATFTVALDNTIIATAIPKITSVLNSLDDVGWYGSSYFLTTTALQPSFGRIYTYFDIRYTYRFALCLFEICSIVCAAPKSSVMLIIGRAIAGAGAAALFSGGITMVGYSVPLEKRAIYRAASSSMFGISSVAGPLLGGAFTDKVSWRWCFWINLPFGAVAFATVAFFKRPNRKRNDMTIKQRILEIDLLGALFLICAIVCLLLALQRGGTTYPRPNSKVWGCLLGFGLLIIIFIGIQFRRGDRSTIPPRIFSQRTVLFSCLFSAFLSMGLYTHIFYVPFFFQAVKSTSAEASGIRTIPYLGSFIVAATVAGGGTTIFGCYKPFMIIGTAIFTIGSGLIYTFNIHTITGKWVGYQFLSGFGAGLGIQIPFTAVQVVLNSKDMPSGNAMTIFNSLGGALSTSIAQNVFSKGLKTEIPKYAPNISPQEIIAAGATHLKETVNSADLPGVLTAYSKALDQAFVIAIATGGLAMICGCFAEWKSVKGKKIVPGAA